MHFNFRKIYIEFLRDFKKSHKSTDYDNVKLDGKIPGKAFVQVYRAVRMRQLKYQCKLYVLSKAEGWKEAQRLNVEREINLKKNAYENGNCKRSRESVLPTMSMKYIQIIITICIDAGHFWAQNYNEESISKILEMENILNSKELTIPEDDIKIGNIYAAKFDENDCYYRCRVESIIPFGKNRNLYAQVGIIIVYYFSK